MGTTATTLPLAVYIAAVLVLATFPSLSDAEVLNFTRSSFNTTDLGEVTVRKDASISGGALQLTPDSINKNFTLLNRSGRIVYSKPFHLWKDGPNSSAPGNIASFNSTFTINIFRPNNNPAGEGLAFIIAPDVEPPSGSEGQWLGLTNASIDGNPSNQFVAIELDTVKQDFDPDDNHLGLDINSVHSNLTVSLSKIGIQLAPTVATNYTVWVQYDGSSMLMRVYIAEEHQPKPADPVINKTINLKQVVKEYSYMGFAGSTGTTAQLNCVLKWNFSVGILPSDDDKKTVKLAVGIGVSVAALVVIAAVIAGYLMYKKKMRNDTKFVGALKSLPGTPREFRFRDLKKATNNFDEKLKLGQGGFGTVYKGVLSKERIEVAVKKFSRENMKGKDDFLAELTIINRLRHRHLVKLIGWCHKNCVLLLVYDYMPNGSLDGHLFDVSENEKILNWERRYNIIAGVASALNYLHHEFEQTVVHRDLKASNIMLDTEFNGRLGDFGLARALENEKTSYAELEGVPGTMGYIAPECFHTGKATRVSDVFAFGAVILEVVCGQRPRLNIEGFHFLVDWVWTLYREGRILDAVDKRLGNDYVVGDALRLLLLGLACSHPIASERPKTQAVVQVISRSVPPPPVPHFKPAFMWPMVGSILEDDSMTNDTTPITSSYYGSEYTTRYISHDSHEANSMA
ncbi:probable L-type lectin-domain containing receptor kinase S.5 [Aristolochia californica]|uniref:probable L-type lectin-domain containing receptor kinase S.5 n=1 Tax=Aristolochia californica TaxID=171875 RepID=UPI0035DDA1AF